MPDQDKQNPATGSESDISKAQSQQQPPNQASQQRPDAGNKEAGQFETEQPGQLDREQPAAGHPDEGLHGEVASRQRTDVEGASFQSEEDSGNRFVGSKGERDTSSELVEDQDFEKDGQGAPEGK